MNFNRPFILKYANVVPRKQKSMKIILFAKCNITLDLMGIIYGTFDFAVGMDKSE